MTDAAYCQEHDILLTENGCWGCREDDEDDDGGPVPGHELGWQYWPVDSFRWVP